MPQCVYVQSCKCVTSVIPKFLWQEPIFSKKKIPKLLFSSLLKGIYYPHFRTVWMEEIDLKKDKRLTPKCIIWLGAVKLFFPWHGRTILNETLDNFTIKPEMRLGVCSIKNARFFWQDFRHVFFLLFWGISSISETSWNQIVE